MRLYRVDIEFLSSKTPETLTKGNLANILFQLNRFKEHKCGILFKNSKSLNDCKDFIENYIKENTNIIPTLHVLNSRILLIEGEEVENENK